MGVSIPDYIASVLQKYQHNYSKKPKHTPLQLIHNHSNNIEQTAILHDISTTLSQYKTTKIQQIIRSLLYYARAKDNTVSLVLNTIAQSQNKPTKHTQKLCHDLLDYCATYLNTGLKYYKGNMILHIDSGASYLVTTEAKRRVVDYF